MEPDVDDKPLVIEEIKERLRLRINQKYDETIENVKHGNIKVPDFDQYTRHDMELLQLAFYNSITGSNYTWNEAKVMRGVNKEAMREASQMRQAFVRECVENAGKELFKKFGGMKWR